MHFKILLVFGLINSEIIIAGSNAIDNGGELLASRFVNVGKAVYQTLLKEQSKLLKPEELENFKKSLDETRINAVSGDIKDTSGRIVDARYLVTDNQAVIEINKSSWENFFTERKKINQLVFHEYLRTIKVDDDNYKVSSQLSHFSGAIDQVSGSTSDGKMIVSEPSDDYVYRGSSAANRDAKTVTFMAGVGLQYGWMEFFKLAYVYKRNTHFEAFYGRSHLGFQNRDLVQVAGSVKQFFGNSFYGSAGIGLRQFDLLEDNGYLSTESNIYKKRDIAAEVFIGNQWQWEYLTMGVDWFGFSVPVRNLNYGDESGTNRVIGSLLRFSLGASF